MFARLVSVTLTKMSPDVKLTLKVLKLSPYGVVRRLMEKTGSVTGSWERIWVAMKKVLSALEK